MDYNTIMDLAADLVVDPDLEVEVDRAAIKG